MATRLFKILFVPYKQSLSGVVLIDVDNRSFIVVLVVNLDCRVVFIAGLTVNLLVELVGFLVGVDVVNLVVTNLL